MEDYRRAKPMGTINGSPFDGNQWDFEPATTVLSVLGRL